MPSPPELADGEGNAIPPTTSRVAGLLWLALVLALFLGLGLTYMAVVPPFEGFDIQAHYAAVSYIRAHGALPRLTGDVEKVSYELIQQPPLYYVVAAAAATGLPVESAAAYARRSRNAYFGGDVTYRQSVTIPPYDPADAAPATIARIVSLFGGLLTVLGTWWLARLIVPERPGFAAAAAAVAALNPVFLFQSVTITNDAWASGACALALACGFEGWLRCRRPLWWLAPGAALGLCGITKYSALLVAVPLALLWLLYLRRTDRRSGFAALGFAALGFSVVGGWWFARNLALYGELVPFRQMGAVILGLYRDEALSIAATLAYGPWFVSSFWGVFVALIAPAAYLDVTRWFSLLGCAGAALAVIRARRAGRTATALALSLLLVWLLVVVLGVVQWARTVTISVQAARLGFVGLSGLGVVMVAGWEVLLPRRWQAVADRVLVAFMAGLALWLVPFLAAAYALPPPVDPAVTPDRAMAVAFAPGMRVVGADFPAGAAIDPGGTMPVRIHFTADRRIEGDYTLFLHLSDVEDQLLYHYDGAPRHGRHPTRQWVPGVVFADTFEIAPTAPVTAPMVTSLTLGFYPFERPDHRLDVLDEQGRSIGDRVLLGTVRFHAESPAAAAATSVATEEAPLATWRNGIRLLAAEVERDAAGAPTGVRLTWSTTRTLHIDYVVFAHVLDAGDAILAQQDREPDGGAWPTSTWRQGDIIPDTLRWGGDVSAWQRLIIGLYGADGERLPLGGAGALGPSAFELAVRADGGGAPAVNP